MCNSFSYGMTDGEEKERRGTRGDRCWERRTRREGMKGSLLKASIMNGIETRIPNKS